MHGPTFMANPLACAVAVASLSLLNKQDMGRRIAHIEAVIRRHIAAAALVKGVKDVRVLGAIGVIEMEEPVNVGEFQKRCVERGIWVRPFGRNVYIMPPYIISDSELKYLIENMIECIK